MEQSHMCKASIDGRWMTRSLSCNASPYPYENNASVWAYRVCTDFDIRRKEAQLANRFFDRHAALQPTEAKAEKELVVGCLPQSLDRSIFGFDAKTQLALPLLSIQASKLFVDFFEPLEELVARADAVAFKHARLVHLVPQQVNVEVRRAAVLRRLKHARVGVGELLGRLGEDDVLGRAGAHVGQVDQRDGLGLIDLCVEFLDGALAHRRVDLGEDVAERPQQLPLLREQVRRAEAVLPVDHRRGRHVARAAFGLVACAGLERASLGRRGAHCLDDGDGAWPAERCRALLRLGDQLGALRTEGALLVPDQSARPQRQGVRAVKLLVAKVVKQLTKNRVRIVSTATKGPVGLGDALHAQLERLVLVAARASLFLRSGRSAPSTRARLLFSKLELTKCVLHLLL
mmetsp:Transcript_22420/g.48954  ORF Transcript_22420/g.48954 Transcript_22420/m.48954 type:complete len:402 (-) Transcript_22420:743-1948(-)